MLVSYYQREALGGIKGVGSREQGAGERESRGAEGTEGAEGEN
ncbi:hypothetical protein [Scytonema millei]|nr:hypothetical protein [Scytonema millei]